MPREIAAEVARALGIAQFHVVSAVTGEGLPALLEDCWRLLKG